MFRARSEKTKTMEPKELQEAGNSHPDKATSNHIQIQEKKSFTTGLDRLDFRFRNYVTLGELVELRRHCTNYFQ